jgi:hypothetical protein
VASCAGSAADLDGGEEGVGLEDRESRSTRTERLTEMALPLRARGLLIRRLITELQFTDHYVARNDFGGA